MKIYVEANFQIHCWIIVTTLSPLNSDRNPFNLDLAKICCIIKSKVQKKQLSNAQQIINICTFSLDLKVVMFRLFTSFRFQLQKTACNLTKFSPDSGHKQDFTPKGFYIDAQP